MSGPSTVKLPPGISNAPSQPSKLHQDGAFGDSPNGLAPEAVDVVVHQPNLSDLMVTMNSVLEVLKDSTIASKDGKDVRSRFWTIHKRVAEEHDGEFLERSTSDMDIVLVFSGLFSAVSTSFIVAMEPSLSPDPSDTTNALLAQLVQIGLGNLAAAAPASTWSPSTSNVRIQGIAYASLCMSLLAAFGAVLAKQWLMYYKSSRYGRGSPEERGKRRQEKFNGIIKSYFDVVVQSFPILLQLSLLLFGIALSANMWFQSHSIAWVIIATTVFGFLFYSLTLMAALVSPACPFQTPISTILRMLVGSKLFVKYSGDLRPMAELALRYFQQLTMSAHDVLHLLHRTLRSRWTRLRRALPNPVHVVRLFAWRCFQPLLSVLHIFICWLRSLLARSLAQIEDSEAQIEDPGAQIEDSQAQIEDPGAQIEDSEAQIEDYEAQSSNWNSDVSAKDQYHLDLHLTDISTSKLEAPSIKWLLETSTDPEVILAAARLLPQVEWPLDLDVSDTLHQLYDIYKSCVDVQSRIIPSLEEKASVCAMALSHLYCGHTLQVCGGYGCVHYDISRSRSQPDCDLFYQMIEGCKAQDKVLSLTARLCANEALWYYKINHDLHPIEFADSAPEWLSHILPYHFVAGKVDEDLEELAIAVISKLLSSPSSLSTQTIANCTLLACVMIGVQFHKKDMVRIDKSSALEQLVESLLEQIQTALWDGLDGDSIKVQRRAWNLTDVICRMLRLGRCEMPSSQVMWTLDLCRKIYSRARSSEQNDADPLAALRRIQRFSMHPVNGGALDLNDPDWVLFHHIPFKDHSYLPEDFDWLVDYLGVIHSDDHDTACDILVLMSSMSVSCSPAKQHVFIERLIACMDSSMPYRLRHLALRAAHSSQEVLTWIDAVDVADTILTKFSPAIMSAVCPRPGTTPAADGPDGFFDDRRDLCYLKLVYALARNPIWHRHLVRDHTERCIGMIAECCQSRFVEHPCYLVGILLRIAPEPVSVTSRGSITEEQSWDIIKRVWMNITSFGVETMDVDKLFLILMGSTKKYMQIASKPDLEQLIEYVDDVVSRVEWQRLECIDDVKMLGTEARNMLLQRFGQ